MIRIKRLVFAVLMVGSYQSSFAQCASASNIYAFSYNGKNYEVVRQNETWINAASCAVSRGGYLAEINDVNEQNALFNALTNNANINNNNTEAPDGGGGAYVWIGGNDLQVEGNWIWDGDNTNGGPQFWQGTANGTPVGGLYNNWGNEPDDYFGQDALAMSLNGWPLGVAGEWNDVDHTNTLYYIIEYDCTSSSSTITESACYSYTSPSGNYNWTSSGTYSDTLVNAANCDSIITINLTINTVSDISTSLNGATITANNGSASYHWLDCGNNNSIIQGETSQTFTATTSGIYAVQLTENSCIDTSLCVNVANLEIVENEFGPDLKLYPNPTRGNFALDLGGDYSKIKLYLFGIDGRQIKQEQHSYGRLIEMQVEQPTGLYLLVIEADGKKAAIKLRKE